MNINLPDKSFKLFIALGIAIFIYSMYLYDKHMDDYDKSFLDCENQVYKVKQLDLLIKRDLKDLKTESKMLSVKYGIEDPIIQTDSLIVFNKTLSDSKEETLIFEILSDKWDKYNNDRLELEQQTLILENLNNKLVRKSEYGEYLDNKLLALQIGCLILFFVGLYNWENEETIGKTKQTEKIYSRCQSCGEGFSAIKLYGTNQDGSSNLGLCHTCYKDGKFIDLNFSEQEYKDYIDNKIKDYGWFRKILDKKKYFNLERWKKKQ